MYFCPQCNYSFDVTKSTNTTDDRKKLDTPNEVFKRIKAKKKLSNYVATFSQEELTSQSIYKKLSDKDKESTKQLFDTKKTFGGIEFKCTNCNYRKQIKDTIRLYQVNASTKITTMNSIEDNKIRAMNPIYPRTKDYTCKNVNCVTHKNEELKEAVFFRQKNTYQTTYLCTVCYNSYNV